MGVKQAPWWFWAVSAVALLWNLMGVYAYIESVTATPEAIIAKYGQVQADMMAAQPAWYTAVFAIAVFAGALGCLCLLLRRKWAIGLLLLSLLCVILQQVYFTMADVWQTVHGGAWAMVILIPVIAIFLVWFSRKASSAGWLK